MLINAPDSADFPFAWHCETIFLRAGFQNEPLGFGATSKDRLVRWCQHVPKALKLLQSILMLRGGHRWKFAPGKSF